MGIKNIKQFSNLIISFVLLLNFLFNSTTFQFSADSSSGFKDGDEDITIFNNDVIIKNEEMILYADKAKNYKDSDKIVVTGNIKMYYQKDTLLCDKLLIFQSKESKYQAEGSILYIQDGMQASCKNLVYWPENINIKATLSGNVEINNQNKFLMCNQLVVYADESKKIEAYEDILFELNDNQKIKCDKLSFWNSDYNVEAYSNVIISDSTTQIYGDSVYVNYDDSLLSQINLFSKTKIISQKFAKTKNFEEKFPVNDIIKGSNMNIKFDDYENISEIDIYEMADIKFNIIKQNLLEGFNNISGDTIYIKFNNNSINQIEILGGAIGEFIPSDNLANIDSTISYTANKIIYDIDKEVSYLSNNAVINYGATILEGGKISANWKNNIIESKQYNQIFPKVITPSNENPMYGTYMAFDLSSNQGKIINGFTDVGIGVFKGDGNQEIFREENNTVHIKNSIFTSCDLDEPHYYFFSDYMKMIPGDKIIAKPMTLYINEFPTLHIPFAIFPNTNNQRRSGWIMPSFGNRSSSGTYVDDLGYYWAPNNYIDVKMLIDFEDKRGLYTQNEIRYNKQDGQNWFNYKMNGSLYIENKILLLENINDFHYLFDKDSTKTIRSIALKHNQSFDPTQNLAINYNFKSERDTNEVDLSKRLDQTLTSNFNYVKRWNNSSVTIGHYQYENLFIPPPDSLNQEQIYKYNNGPNIIYNLNSMKLFGNGDYWYNNIYFSYNLNYNYGKNNYYKYSSISNGIIDWGENQSEYVSGGLRNHIKLSMSNQFGWLSLVPSISIKEDWIAEYADQSEDNEEIIFKKGFHRRNIWNININANTKIYGIIPINNGNIQSLRHKMTPELSISYQPDFSEHSSDSIDPFYSSSLGSVNSGYSRLSFWLRNSVQAKIKSETGNYIKRDILSWDFTLSYDPNRENLGENNLSNLSSFISFKKANGGEFLSIQMQHSLYNDSGELIDLGKKELPSLKYFNAQISTKINLNGQDYFYNKEESNKENISNMNNDSDSLLSILDYIPKMNDKKWETDFYLNLSGGFKEQTEEWDLNYCNIESRTTFQLTKNWLLTHAALFNLTDMKIQSQSIRFHRPLHCWNFGFTWWPSGYSKGFRLEISINQPDLQDIKITSSSSNRRFGN